VRKTKSRFGGRLEPTSHVSLLLYEGRELDIISQAESVYHFRTIREELDRLAAAVNMLEVVDQVAQERESSPRCTRCCWRTRTLAAKPSALVVAGFYWKLLDLEGLRLEPDHCVTCGSDVDLVAFDVDQGGVLCRTCRRGRSAPRRSPDAPHPRRGLASALTRRGRRRRTR
jgi:DNA repair protein RecO (recombination protein O)